MASKLQAWNKAKPIEHFLFETHYLTPIPNDLHCIVFSGHVLDFYE